MTHIGRFVFDGCSGLKSIVIPDSVTSIGHGAFKGCSQLELIIAPEHLHDNFRTEYPDKTIMTQAQCDNAIARKIQQHTQGSSSAQDTEKITEMVKTLSPGTKASLMALEIPEGQTFSNLSTEALVQCFGDEPASLLPLLGIEAKELAIKDNLDVGSLVESHLTVRDKLILDATVKGEVLKQPRPNNTVKTSRVISLGQSLEASDSLSMQSDQGSQEGAVEEKPSTTSPTPRS